MYRNILVAIEHSASDDAILRHIEQLAKLTGASLLLVHVSDGWAARYFDDLGLRESEEMRDDREYLQQLVDKLNAGGLTVRGKLALGDPATELINTARQEAVDLVAMATHGHRWLNDLVRGTTVNRVRHEITVPVLLVRAGSSP
jgi:nucleotide-binding universal stress UspA family protein